jgi:S1-C subfamily serine protease
LTKLQRGAAVAFIVAVVGGVSLLFTTFFTEASVFTSHGNQERQYQLSSQGYRVVYNKNSNEQLTNYHFAACQDVSDFKLLDENWRSADTDNFDKVVCR